jgi:hypothetical protein
MMGIFSGATRHAIAAARWIDRWMASWSNVRMMDGAKTFNIFYKIFYIFFMPAINGRYPRREGSDS